MAHYDVQNPPLMGCGHTANATDAAGDPCCVICVGIVPGAETVVEKPSLEGRRAMCSYATGRDGQPHDPEGVPSGWGLPFFEHRPGKGTDTYYCGCWGWD